MAQEAVAAVLLPGEYLNKDVTSSHVKRM